MGRKCCPSNLKKYRHWWGLRFGSLSPRISWELFLASHWDRKREVELRGHGPWVTQFPQLSDVPPSCHMGHSWQPHRQFKLQRVHLGTDGVNFWAGPALRESGLLPPLWLSLHLQAKSNDMPLAIGLLIYCCINKQRHPLQLETHIYRLTIIVGQD